MCGREGERMFVRNVMAVKTSELQLRGPKQVRRPSWKNTPARFSTKDKEMVKVKKPEVSGGERERGWTEQNQQRPKRARYCHHLPLDNCSQNDELPLFRERRRSRSRRLFRNCG